MFAALAFVSFGPMIEDAMIQQLQENDPKRTKVAAAFIQKAMRGIDLPRAYALWLKVEIVSEVYQRDLRNLHLNNVPDEEFRAARDVVKSLYGDNWRLRQLKHYKTTYCILYLDQTPQRKSNKEIEKEFRKVIGNLLDESEGWGTHTNRDTLPSFVTRI